MNKGRNVQGLGVEASKGQKVFHCGKGIRMLKELQLKELD